MRDPRNIPDKSFMYVDISAIDRDLKVINSAPEILGADAPSRARKEIRKGDILVSTVRPNLNTVALVPPELDGHIASTGFCVLRPNRAVTEGQYLFYFTTTPYFIGRLTGKVRGAHYPAVSDSDVKAVKISLPPISEQRRIVEILDQADRLRKLRADANAKARHILPALFIEMFGDPVANRKKWPIEKLGIVGILERGKSKHRPMNDPILLGGIHPLIQTGDVANSGGRISNYTQTYSDVGLSQSRMWPSGTLCITIAANIAKTGILEFDACFPDSIVGFHPGPYVTTEYVQSWLWFLQLVLENSAPQAAQKNINLQVLRSLPIPIPPKQLQEKFSRQTIQLNQQKSKMRKESRKIELLLKCLQHRAFTGDLTASWREAHMKELLQEMERQSSYLEPMK
jgi:type I restriction enzyme S subunit